LRFRFEARSSQVIDEGVRPCRGRATVVASLWRSALRADCAAMLGAGSRRAACSANGVRCARTGAASQTTRRA